MQIGANAAMGLIGISLLLIALESETIITFMEVNCVSELEN